MELYLGDTHSPEVLGEDSHVRVANRIRFFASKFIEGFFVIDAQEIPDSLLAAVKSRDDLRSLPVAWGCMTNAIIARSGGNQRLRVFKPAGIEGREIDELPRTPEGIREQVRTQSSGHIDPLADENEVGIPLAERHPGPIHYPIVPESDLNGAGLVYFVRYVAMMNFAERIFLSEHLECPASSEFVASLSTEHRRSYFFANASPADVVDLRVSGRLLPPSSFAEPPASRPYRTPLKLVFRFDLYRRSDNVLMGSSLVRKALNVPGSAKAVLAEARRVLALHGGGPA
jgi:hypothetical protein